MAACSSLSLVEYTCASLGYIEVAIFQYVSGTNSATWSPPVTYKKFAFCIKILGRCEMLGIASSVPARYKPVNSAWQLICARSYK